MNTLPYRAPVDDLVFVLTDVLRMHERPDLDGFDLLDAEGIRDFVSEAARFHEEVLAPISLPGDAEGARLQDGAVVTPAGFREAWERYRAAGWPFVSVPDDLGGGGLPPILSAIVSELRMSTAHSFAMYGAFCSASATMIGALGEPWMRSQIAPRLATGEWTATMCLTESHAGSDLRRIRTRAIAQDDGTWRITGEKIFISGGDHDLTDNIVHVVLAKIPDADGRLHDDLASIGVFVVPKVLVDPDSGALSEPNALGVANVEHKMGVEGSATCTLAFDGAVAWRIVDERAAGIAHSMGPMFFLMNKARVSTAMSGVAYAELSYQVALAYARERTSGHAPGRTSPESAADPLVSHPDIRRLLLSSRSFAEGARALGLRVALLQSEAECLDDGDARAIVELMTPVMKAYFTDKGFECASNCLQVFGGHGYIRDYGIEQVVRNARVGQIYEGANGIQARDLVRMVTGKRAPLVEAFFAAIGLTLERARASHLAAPFADAVATASAALNRALHHVRQSDDASRAAVAYDLLTAFGTLAIAWTWLDVLMAAEQVGDAALVEQKRAMGQVWIDREVPMLHAYVARVEAGGGAVVALADDAI